MPIPLNPNSHKIKNRSTAVKCSMKINYFKNRRGTKAGGDGEIIGRLVGVVWHHMAEDVEDKTGHLENRIPDTTTIK